MLRNGSKGYLLAISIVLGSCLGLPSADLHSAVVPKEQNQKLRRCKRCNERSLSPDREQRIYKKIVQQANASRKAMGGKKGSTGPSSVKSRGMTSKSITFPRPVHFIHEDTKRLGDIVTIKCGSEWNVKESDREIVKTWEVDAPITFTPNINMWAFFTHEEPMYKFKVVNLETNESVEANLSKGPYTNSVHARRIRRMDKERGDVYFNDGTLWKAPTGGVNAEIFKGWKVGDYVLAGRNDTWYSFQNQDIIINVSADNWIPVQRVF